MLRHRADAREFLRLCLEALSRYRLRTALSVLGVVLGVAAVIAMMSVSEGAARQALAQVEALGLDNLVARSTATSAFPVAWRGLTAADAGRAVTLVPQARASSPLIHRALRVSAERAVYATVLGVRPSYQDIVRLAVEHGRFISPIDERALARRCVLGAGLARQLFGFRSPVGERVRIGNQYYDVIGVLRRHGAGAAAGATLAWHDLNQAVLVPFETLSGRSFAVAPEQAADEIWVQIADGSRAEELGAVFQRALAGTGTREFQTVIPRELLAQRYRTQRTFAIVVSSVAVLALIIGGIGITNIMLTSVVERTREIGIRRTVGATRRDITLQFLAETLMMTVCGGVLGIVIGVGLSWGITAYAGWATYVSLAAVALGFGVSMLVGLVFGWYPAVKAADLEPVIAMRHE